MLSRAAGIAATLNGSPEERAKLVRGLVDKVVVDEKTIIIKLRRGALLGGDVPSSASEDGRDAGEEAGFSLGVPMVRIHLPPAASHKNPTIPTDPDPNAADLRERGV
jgi:hypothetical protein